MLKDDTNLTTLDIPEGAPIMLMGTAEGKSMDIENIEKRVFIEELTPEQRAKFYKENMGVICDDWDHPCIRFVQSRQHLLC